MKLDTSEIKYIPGFSIKRYLNYVKKHFPEWFSYFWFDRLSAKNFSLFVKNMEKRGWEFDISERGGGGESYIAAQKNPLVRMKGMIQLLNFVSPRNDFRNLPKDFRILDILGGDGAFARTFFKLSPGLEQIILTSDISGLMVVSTLKYGLPAIRQPANYLLLKNSCLDAVIFAYGTHHLSHKELTEAINETFRVLKTGGKIVIHDFEENSPVAKWFHEVVNKYSPQGHPYSHFNKSKMIKYLKRGGFQDIKVQLIYDPFVFYGSSLNAVKNKFINYLMNTYDLKLLKQKYGERTKKVVFDLSKHYFIYNCFHTNRKYPSAVTISRERTNYKLEMPRLALVAQGIKP